MAPLKNEKDARLLGSLRPLEAEIVAEQALEERGKRERALPLSLAANAKAVLCEAEILDIEPEYFLRAEPAEKHQMNDGEISIASEAPEKGANLLRRQRLDQEVGLLHSNVRHPGSKPMKSEVAIEAQASVVGARTYDTRPLVELVTRAESEEQPDGAQAAIDRPRSRSACLLDGHEVDEIGAS
jgi:hypothetical protein